MTSGLKRRLRLVHLVAASAGLAPRSVTAATAVAGKTQRSKRWTRLPNTAGCFTADDAIRVIERRQMFVGLAERFDESMILLQALRERLAPRPEIPEAALL